MGNKTYLSKQIKLVSLSTFDLFTEDEKALYNQILSLKNILDNKDVCSSLSEDEYNKTVEDKRKLIFDLTELTKQHRGTVRKVNLESILDYRTENKQGVTWWGLKNSRRIAEFCSEQSRLMDLKENEVTFDKIIIKWKNEEILHQIMIDGLEMDVLNEETGEITTKFYKFFTASAGQLRRDKIQMMTEEMQNKIKPSIECGMTWERINSLGGINVSKILAYTALSGGATELWDIDIDKCIVIDEFENHVEGIMDYISTDYKKSRGSFTQKMDQTDGVGMLLDKQHPFMGRGPWLKGLFVHFPYLKFCEKHGCPPILKDCWGDYHRLDTEDIRVIITTSQLKLWKFYKNWNEYKQFFKEFGCHLCKTNWEDEFENGTPDDLLDIRNTEINYQMLQTLSTMTDEEIDSFCKETKEKIENLVTDQDSMKRTLSGTRHDKWKPVDWCLNMYSPLLRDGYMRETIKAIKKKMVLNAKSGYIKCKNKRLFACPDLYAACEYWFLHIKEPNGLIPENHLASKRYRGQEVDVLRSPHLYMEHAIRTVIDDDSVYEWLDQDVVYTSCHDLTSRILQFDWDGDHLNMVSDKTIIDCAKRTIKELDIVPLFYDAQSAPKEQISFETMYDGIIRAHLNSGIGQVSNSLTKIWNRGNVSIDAAAFITAFNNWVIDAAKTGDNNDYNRYPEAAKLINKATGGKTGKMPYFFQFSKNGRRAEGKSVMKPGNSTMDRMALYFEDVGKKQLNFNYAGVAPFNYRMLLDEEPTMNENIIELFCSLDDANMAAIIEQNDEGDRMESGTTFNLLRDYIVNEITKVCTLEEAYPSITKYLFSGANFDKQSHKQMYWRVFGEIAEKTLRKNLENCKTCSSCGMQYPEWENHICADKISGFCVCLDCGVVFEKPRRSPAKRCKECAEKAHKLQMKITQNKRKQKERRLSKCIISE